MQTQRRSQANRRALQIRSELSPHLKRSGSNVTDHYARSTRQMIHKVANPARLVGDRRYEIVLNEDRQRDWIVRRPANRKRLLHLAVFFNEEIDNLHLPRLSLWLNRNGHNHRFV